MIKLAETSRTDEPAERGWKPPISVRPWSPAARMLVAIAVLAASTGLRVATHVTGRGPQRSIRPIPVLKINLNAAPAHILEILPHIGPRLASRIIAERERRPFDSINDLGRRVRGLGPATLAQLSPHLSFEHSAEPIVAVKPPALDPR